MNVRQLEDIEGVLKVLEVMKFKELSVLEISDYWVKLTKFGNALKELKMELNAPLIKPIEPADTIKIEPITPTARGRPKRS